MADKPTVYRVLRAWPNKLPAPDRYGSVTVQIDIPKGAVLHALPRELVSLADYEALEREVERLVAGKIDLERMVDEIGRLRAQDLCHANLMSKQRDEALERRK